MSSSVDKDTPTLTLYLGDSITARATRNGKRHETCARAIQLNPGKADFQAKLGHCVLLKRRVRSRRDALKKALAMSPEDAIARINLAKTYLKAGKKEQALAELMRGCTS